MRLLRQPHMQLILAIAMVTMFGGAVISPALPQIQAEFGVAPESIGLLMTAFTFPGVIAIPIVGVLADRYGRRRVIAPLLLLYGTAGGLCAFAPSFEVLLALRLLSGIGAGALATLSLILVGDTFADDRDRVAALGYRVAFGQVTNGTFPLLGGLLALLGWQYPFLLFFCALPVGLMALAVLEDLPPGGGRKATLSSYLREVWSGISSRRTRSLLTVAPTLMIINQGVVLTYFPIFLHEAFGISAALIGLVISVRVITGTLVASQMRRIAGAMREEWLVVGTLVLLGVAVATVPLAAAPWQTVAALLVVGACTGIGFPAFQSLLVAEAPRELRAGVMSANGVSNRLGQAAGPLLGGLLYGLGGINLVFYGGAAFLLVMAGFLGLVFRAHLRRTVDTDDDSGT